jgi:hypothetical protein
VITSWVTISTGRSFLVTAFLRVLSLGLRRSVTRLRQIVTAAAGDLARQPPLDPGERDGQACGSRRRPCRLPRSLQGAAITGEVGQDE